MIGTVRGREAHGPHLVALRRPNRQACVELSPPSPHPGKFGGDSWNGYPYDKRTGASIWTAGSYDPATGLAFFGVGQTYDTGPLIHP